jgi:hypothetical protein
MLKTMTGKSSFTPAMQGENAADWKHFYGEIKRSSPLELPLGPLLIKCKGGTVESRYPNEVNIFL